MDEFSELSEKRLKELAKMPIVETRVTVSKDRKYVIHKTMITDIKPLSYYEKVIDNNNTEEESEAQA